MIKKIGLGVLAVLVLIVIAALLRPSDFHVERSIAIKASPSKVFAVLNDFGRWNDWSPWAKIDPNAKTTIEGPTSGPGAVLKWKGNSDVGAGSMTLTESHAHQLIRIKLDFTEPFASQSDVEFRVNPDSSATVVTWAMSGKNNFMAKVFGLFVNCDKMIGDDFEKGLANLKSLVEAP